jgi:hypothetical protein
MKIPVIALLAPFLLYSLGTGSRGDATPVSGSTPDAASAILSLPIAFEPNQGQSDPSVKFLAHDLSGAGYTLSLTEDSAIFETGGPASSTVRMKIAKARKAAISGADPLTGKVNYFIGNDPAKWITSGPTYARVAYRQVYSGVDLFFYGTERRLEYDFVVAPGADASQIVLEFSAAKPRLDAEGNLQVPFRRTLPQAEAPSFFVFGGGPYVAATHLNYSLIGPTSLYPGYSTPAAPGETIVLYANGFGPTSNAVVAGAETQSGMLSPLPIITIGGLPATVSFAGLVAPGEFQFNVMVPSSAGNGDQPIVATYGGMTTQAGTLITVQ